MFFKSPLIQAALLSLSLGSALPAQGNEMVVSVGAIGVGVEDFILEVVSEIRSFDVTFDTKHGVQTSRHFQSSGAFNAFKRRIEDFHANLIERDAISLSEVVAIKSIEPAAHDENSMVAKMLVRETTYDQIGEYAACYDVEIEIVATLEIGKPYAHSISRYNEAQIDPSECDMADAWPVLETDFLRRIQQPT